MQNKLHLVKIGENGEKPKLLAEIRAKYPNFET